MSQLGFKVMMDMLGGRGGKVPSDYYGRMIKTARLDEENNDFLIQFEDGTRIKIFDDGQSCCESRYMKIDDDPASLVGQIFTRLEGKTCEEKGDGGNDYMEHDIVFVEVGTDQGCVTLVNHNVHNGYYGGFSIRVEEVV